MKNLYLIIFLFIGIAASAQAPDKMSYQAVIRDASGALLKNQDVTIQFSIIQTSPAGTIVYREDHRATTNSNGLASIYIGTGNIAIGSFSTIDWASGPYFLQTDIDPLAGASYVISSTTELVSVPYALHANVADSLIGGVNETDPVFNGSIAKGISTTDTAYWNGKLDGYTETDPVFNQSVASSITAGDTAAWNNHLSVDLDTDATNELQTISFVNDTLQLSKTNGVFLGNLNKNFEIPLLFPSDLKDSLPKLGSLYFDVQNESFFAIGPGYTVIQDTTTWGGRRGTSTPGTRIDSLVISFKPKYRNFYIYPVLSFNDGIQGNSVFTLTGYYKLRTDSDSIMSNGTNSVSGRQVYSSSGRVFFTELESNDTWCHLVVPLYAYTPHSRVDNINSRNFYSSIRLSAGPQIKLRFEVLDGKRAYKISN